MKIKLLDSSIFNRIAAGEVVERPASIVKELVENSIDAGATVISIEIEEGGKKKITVSDNGHGIEKDDLETAFMPHATSKIKTIEDLDTINTLGFRGEALASIASVCHIYASSKTEDDDYGYSIRIDGGLFSEIKPIARNKGTTIEASDLFYNAPVREKFMRKAKREESEITNLVEKFMLAHPEISFLYIADGKKIYNTISTELSNIIYTIYGKEVFDNLIKVDCQTDGIEITGFVVSPKFTRSNRTYQTLFVNGRFVENYLISSAVQGAFEPFLMKGRFPVYVLGLKVNPQIVDVNVHPTKKEVRFQNPNFIFSFVLGAIQKALQEHDMIASFGQSKFDEKEFSSIELRDRENKQGFFDIPLVNLEPLSNTEGKSYSEVIKKEKVAKGKFENQETVIQTPQKDEIEIPDFFNIKIDDNQPVNKRGGPLFFDQTESVHANDFLSLNKNTQNKFIQADISKEIKILGTLFNTYIVVEYDNKAYFIDQHAAHERILFDELCQQADAQQVIKQPLLIKFLFKASREDISKIVDSINVFDSLGFELKEKDDGVEVESVPLLLANIDLQEFFDNLLTDKIIWNKSASQILKSTLAQYACKHAIKAGDKIKPDDIAFLIEQVRKGVLLCPHGRPIIVEMLKKDFEKLFKRIV